MEGYYFKSDNKFAFSHFGLCLSEPIYHPKTLNFQDLQTCDEFEFWRLKSMWYDRIHPFLHYFLPMSEFLLTFFYIVPNADIVIHIGLEFEFSRNFDMQSGEKWKRSFSPSFSEGGICNLWT